jgi:16S rRNA A1518/A1519 N6-dimethyltransferase RsmA/KsgA/DIM1 with predicted DNA glycosylase/AP lyase activity
MVSLAEIKPTERVLEIGTGRGALTRELVESGASLVGYEIDRGNFEETLRVVRGSRVRILLADAFDQNPEFDVLVSSLPYSASATFVQWLSGIKFKRAIVLMQEDFIRKILAPPGTRDYRGISALTQLCFEVGVLDRVKRASFSPQPRVSSVIASFVPRLRISKSEVSQIMRLFTLRRRRADSALAELGTKWDGSFGQRRVYALRPEEVHLLCLPTSS